jgi:VIT1/CCC1 family predicted Fe2+/Mn2+ transporter
MSTVAEILAAIKTLSPEERDEIKLYLRQLMVKDSQNAANEKTKQKPQAPLGAKSL